MSPQSLAVPAAPPASEDDQIAINFWRKRFEKRHPSNPILTTLDVEYNELALSWKRFQENLPPEDQVVFQERPQTPEDVVGMVRGVQSVWMSSPKQRVFSRSMALGNVFLSTMDSHSVLLMTLPKNEFYMSLFYGVLQSIIKASASYPRIMEGLMKMLVRVNESIALPEGAQQLLFSKDSILPIARFYLLTFFLLGELMDWYVRRSKCRVLKSLNQDVYADFKGLVWSIRNNARDIKCGIVDGMDKDDAEYDKKRKVMQHSDLFLWEQARLSQVGLQKWERRFAAQNAMTRQLIWEIQLDASDRLRMTNERDALLSEMLDSASHCLRPVDQQNSGIACLTTTAAQDLGMQDGYLGIDRRLELTLPSSQDTSRFQWSEGPKHKYTRVELQFATRHLQDFFDSDDQVADFEYDMDVIAEESLATSLRQWAINPHSQVLAVGGPPSTVFPSPVALISACYACFARQARLPVISHFCSLPSKMREGLTFYEQGLIALTYSLIRQLIDCLPPVLEGHAACNLSTERFNPLNGTLTCWKEVLSLIDILLYYAPPLLVCVIDGLDVLQDMSTDRYIRSLVRTLMTHTRHQTVVMPDGSESQSVLLKVLFTVTGRPSSLVETLSEKELILSESNRADDVTAVDQSLNPDVGVVMMNA